MRPLREHLINTPEIELWPAALLRARRGADARAIAQSHRVLRRKRDGRFLAAAGPHGLHALQSGLQREPGMDLAIAALAQDGSRRSVRDEHAVLPMLALERRLALLGLDRSYGDRTGLALVPEPVRLAFAGHDRYRRPLWLRAPVAHAWRRMRAAAATDAVTLDAISGYRSHAYQLGIFERKRARGLEVEQILAVNAAPGYSEHHGGTALDIGTPGEPPAEESFERTAAFAWLQRRAGEFGFVLSYPRGNSHGIVYEPWHWCWRRA
jgi:zinc D-Ala-D-Ala carboxypeptidase